MKLTISVLLSVGFTFVLFGDANARTWTRNSGMKVEAEFEYLNPTGGKVWLRNKDGDLIHFTANKLIKEDRDFIKKELLKIDTERRRQTVEKKARSAQQIVDLYLQLYYLSDKDSKDRRLAIKKGKYWREQVKQGAVRDGNEWLSWDEVEKSEQTAKEKIDEAVLALLYLTLHEDCRAWKNIDWEAMNRLHQKGFILDPVNKAKSVVLTKEGQKKSEASFHKLFAKN